MKPVFRKFNDVEEDLDKLRDESPMLKFDS